MAWPPCFARIANLVRRERSSPTNPRRPPLIREQPERFAAASPGHQFLYKSNTSVTNAITTIFDWNNKLIVIMRGERLRIDARGQTGAPPANNAKCAGTHVR